MGQATLLDVRQAEVTKGTERCGPAPRGAGGERGQARPVPPHGRRASGAGRSDRAHRFVSGDRARLPARQRCSRWPISRTRRSARSGRGEHAAGSTCARPRAEFLPTLSLQAGWSGFTQQFTNENILLGQALADAQAQAADCQYNNAVRAGLSLGGQTADCFAAAGLTPAAAACWIRWPSRSAMQNNVFPFQYTGQPFQANLTRLAAHLHRLRPLAPALPGPGAAGGRGRRARGPGGSRCGPTCMPAISGCRPPIRRSRCRRPAAKRPRDQLRLAQDRYRLGAGTALEVSDAQNAVQRAEGDYVNAVYDYHKAIAALEAAVGRPLR